MKRGRDSSLKPKWYSVPTPYLLELPGHELLIQYYIVNRLSLLLSLSMEKAMSENSATDESEVLKQVIDSLRNLNEDSRNRLLKTLLTYFDYRGSAPTSNGSGGIPSPKSDREPFFGDRPALSPKDFMHEKDPKTDVERVTCLAYYLTNYRDKPHFKTVDISQLNTEAAQIKLSNPSASIENATAAGLLTTAGGGSKQISVHGDKVVMRSRTGAR